MTIAALGANDGESAIRFYRDGLGRQGDAERALYDF